MPVIAPVVPPACAACHQQPLDKRFVDFQVAYDGPILPEQEGGARYAIDDLIICETCLQDGAKLVGFGDVESAVASSERFASAAEAAEDRAEAAEERLEVVRSAFEALGVEPTLVDRPAVKPKPRKRVG